MAKSLLMLFDARKSKLRAQIAQKDEEIAKLKADLTRRNASNDELSRENRRLSIENAELKAAKACLEELLINRGNTPELKRT